MPSPDPQGNPAIRGARFRHRGCSFHNFSTEDGVTILKEKRPQEEPQVSKNRGLPRFFSAVTGPGSEPPRSDGTRTAKERDRKQEDRADETENSMNGDSQKANRQG